jgi:hypothetical protein
MLRKHRLPAYILGQEHNDALHAQTRVTSLGVASLNLHEHANCPATPSAMAQDVYGVFA